MSASSAVAVPSSLLATAKANLQEIREQLASPGFTAEAGVGICERIRDLSIDASAAVNRTGLLYQLQAYFGLAEDRCMESGQWQRRDNLETSWRSLVFACDAIGTALDAAGNMVATKAAARRSLQQERAVGISVAMRPWSKPAEPAPELTLHRALMPELARVQAELGEGLRPGLAERVEKLVAAYRRAAVLDGTFAKEDYGLAHAEQAAAHRPERREKLIDALDWLATLAANQGLNGEG